jgi:hypothetical protein
VVWFADVAEKAAVGLLFGLGTGDRGLTCSRNSGKRIGQSGRVDSSPRSDSARWLKRVKNVSTLGLHWWDAVRTKDKPPNLPSMFIVTRVPIFGHAMLSASARSLSNYGSQKYDFHTSMSTSGYVDPSISSHPFRDKQTSDKHVINLQVFYPPSGPGTKPSI